MKQVRGSALSADKPNAYITVKMGPKAAILIGRLIDDQSAEASPAAVPAQATFRILLPPNEDVEVEVTSESYSSWTNNDSLLTHLEPESITNIDVHLYRTE